MALSMSLESSSLLGPGVWLCGIPPHEMRTFGECRHQKGTRSVLLLSAARFDESSKTLQFALADATPANVGTTSEAIAILVSSVPSPRTEPARAIASTEFGPGDREFLNELELLPPHLRKAAGILLRAVRQFSPGDLKRGLKRNFSNTPDNFWYVIVQPQAEALSITVRGRPERFSRTSLNLKEDRPGYTRFKVARLDDVEEAIKLIHQSRRK